MRNHLTRALAILGGIAVAIAALAFVDAAQTQYEPESNTHTVHTLSP